MKNITREKYKDQTTDYTVNTHWNRLSVTLRKDCKDYLATNQLNSNEFEGVQHVLLLLYTVIILYV